ncbi:unnamed protein product [Effrenium voratum]|uniref:RNA helicase n=1 Tax=Effrenium voratum TaxID=2562239 RepID=A0AA36J4A0_9DINO|nr:unnamed protein product [Effrenium voratum]CAJ1423881.1 unnamed protein product [Effrenium voratum]CAJ1454442.1 unnamed protein product [Effrenium voratum]
MVLRKRRKDPSGTETPKRKRQATEAVKPAPAAPRQSLFQTDVSFAKLGLARWIVDTCAKLGMAHPTDIQAMCIPPILAGKNIAGNARTGSGKTAAYSLPILHHLSKDPYGVFALVLVPVRELAFQVTENFRAMGQSIGVTVAEIVGGRDFSIQSQTIADRSHILVATPGRLADLLRGDFALAKAFRKLHTLVLDEADQLLTQTFDDPLGQILEVLPKSRQTLFFSATVTQCIEKLKKGKELTLIDANPNEESLETLTQLYVFVPKSVQINYLHYLLQKHFPEESCIVFAASLDECQLLTTMLDILGFEVTGLHSLQSQRQRLASLGKFRASRAKILVATDVAGRGLDIPSVAVVLNMGLPYDGDSYVHRAGRTARAGRPGKVVTLMSELDVSRVEAIERRIGKQLELLPTKEEEAIKLLSKTTKALQRAELLLSEVGFADQIAEHRGAQKEQKKKKAQAPGSQAQADSKELTGSKGLKKKGLKKNPKALGKATAKHKA